jgi:hypothetical protein
MESNPRNRWFAASLLKGDGFELSVPRTISYRFGTGLEIIAKLAALRSR